MRRMPRRNIGRAFLGSTININGNELAVPMELLWRVGVVVDVDNDPFAFRKSH